MPANTDGRWGPLELQFSLLDDPKIDDGAGHDFKDTRGLFVLHAVLLHTGKVLVFCGHVEGLFYAPVSYVFNPKDPFDLLTPKPFPAGTDMFCCHYVQLPIGRILVLGGSEKSHGSNGGKYICIFDPPSETWGNTHKFLHTGRWYPTAVLLPDERVMVVSGRPEHGGGSIADKVEFLDPPRRASTEGTGTPLEFPIYPGLHLAPNGLIYFTATTWGQEIDNPNTASIEVTSGATSASWTVYGGTAPAQPRREEGMSVLLPLVPPAYKGEILVIGGTTARKSGVPGVPVLQGALPRGPVAFDHINQPPTDSFSAEILDTTNTPPKWSSAPGGGVTTHGRTNGHCVLLPDATVLVLGGHDGYKWQRRPTTTPSMVAEIFTPNSGFRVAAETPPIADNLMKQPRMYHSIAMLVPDGRVLVAGGADPNRFEPLPDPALLGPPAGYRAGWVGRTYPAGTPLNDKTFEFYEPPYYFKPDRASQPDITGVLRNGISTKRIRYGQTFTVRTPQAASIAKVALIRPGACTHHTDSEQRYIELVSTPESGELNVTAVPSTKVAVAPPGWYMLWIVDNNGRPCKEAVFVHLVR